MPETTAVDLLKRTESYLSALHGSVARHDNLAANLGCAGCELRDQIRAALPTLSTAPSAPADRAALRDRIAMAIEDAPYRHDGTRRAWQLADAVLAVLPAPADRAAIYREVAEELAGINFHPNAKSQNLELCRLLAGRFLRKADEAEYVATPCGVGGCEPGGEPCSTHERLMAHAEGDHELCGPDCGTSPDRMAVDELAATTCSAQYHGHGETRLCIRAAQHTGKAHTDEHGIHWSDTVAVYPLADGQFRTGINVRAELRRMADEAQQPETQAEDPARIDRLRPEFFEYASVESIDVQIQRAQRQQRQWANRMQTLTILRQARVLQKELGEWPAAVSQPGKEA
jgi:hypothetical protein